MALFVLVATGLGGCVTRTPVDAPSVRASPLPETVEPEPFRLQPGDRLAIRFWGTPELDQEVVVRSDGVITLPLVDEVRAAGKRPSELDDELTRLYQTELARPEIAVIVVESRTQSVHIGGEVADAGPVEVHGALTLYRAVQEAGGFLTTARLRQVLVIRLTPEGVALARTVDLRPFLSGKDPSADIRLEAGDIVYVPRTKIANANLFVAQYIRDLLPLQTFTSVRAVGIGDR